MKIGKKKFQIVDVHINSNSDALSAASLFKSLCMVDWSLCTCKLLSEAIECSPGAPYESPWAQLFEGRLALNPGFKTNPSFFLLCSKAFSRIISLLFLEPPIINL